MSPVYFVTYVPGLYPQAASQALEAGGLWLRTPGSVAGQIAGPGRTECLQVNASQSE